MSRMSEFDAALRSAVQDVIQYTITCEVRSEEQVAQYAHDMATTVHADDAEERAAYLLIAESISIDDIDPPEGYNMLCPA